MAARRSTKGGRRRHERSGPGRKSSDSSRTPVGAGLKKQPNLFSGTNERQNSSRFSDVTLIAFLVVGATLPYLNALRNGFVADDETQVLQNPYIRNIHYLAKIFTSQAASYVPQMPNFYRPLMNVGYLLCYQVFGPRAFGFHLVNVVLHVIVVCAVFLLTKRMFQSRDLALMATALFAIHPVHSEAVAWIAASPDLELSLFYLLAFWFFLAGARPGGRFSYGTQLAMGGSFVLALLSKEQAVTLPVLATVYEHFYRADRKETRPTGMVMRYALLWLLAVAYLLFRVRVLGALSSGIRVHHLTWYQTFLSALALLGQYFWKLLWPVNLRLFCPFHRPSGLFDPAVITGAGALTVCCALFFYLWRHSRLLSFGLLWMLVTLAPVLNARWMPIFAFAERYLYLPSVSFCWLLGWGFLRWRAVAPARGAIGRRALATAFGVLVVACALRTITQNRDWQNNLTLYASTLAACPDAFYVRRDLGTTYWEMGNAEFAEREWREALTVAPQDPLTLVRLGALDLKNQHYSEAVEFFKEALEVDPGNPDAHLYLGVTYMQTHSLALAESELRTAVSLFPLNSNARNALGMLYVGEGRAAEAEEQFRQSVEVEPNMTGYGNLGLLHWHRGDVKLAEQEWREALRLAPNDPSILNYLGLVCTKQGRYTEAVSFLRKAVKLNPDDPRAHLDLGVAYEKTALNGPAETEFLVALSLAPQNVEARNRLGMIYLSAGRLGEAEKQFRLSVKTEPNDSGYCGLGEIYVRRGNRGAAQRAFQSAASINPDDSQAHFKLGALYIAQGQRAQALREYQAGLKNDPEDADALAAVQKLSGHVREK
ncbi:MAG TPA: tetratricopeptide repeat protein [Terriglobia bacterium]|nr:tetratricopeptide repeat protein [Terriglobia bacterium]